MISCPVFFTASARGTRADDQPPKNQDEDADEYCARVANALCGDLDIPAMGPGAIDLTIEASGAPTCIQIGVHVLKPA
jgi:D-xylulose reductase